MVAIKIIKMDVNLEYQKKYNDFVSRRVDDRRFINMHVAYTGNKPTNDELDQYYINVDRFKKIGALPFLIPNENVPVKAGNIELNPGKYGENNVVDEFKFYFKDDEDEFLGFEDDEPIFEENDED